MPNHMLDAALAYAKKGWPVFPATVAKTPMVENGFYDATTDPRQITDWWTKWPGANIGFSCGEAALLVVDRDPGSSVAELEKNLGEKIAGTHLKAKTPRGGDHLYYALAKDEQVQSSTNRIAKHVDVRSTGGYVLLPPSKTADGVYEWVEQGMPAHRQDSLRLLCAAAREKHKDRDVWLIEPDMDENRLAAIEYLKTEAKPAVKGAGGNATAYKTAAMMCSYGLSPETALEVMWEHWAPRCTPAWYSHESLSVCVDHGYEYHTSPPGNLTAAYKAAQYNFKPAAKIEAVGETDDIRRTKGGKFTIANDEGLKTTPPISWLIPGFLPTDAYCIMFGSHGTFKTFLALDIALSIASGHSMWNGNAMWECSDPGPVLFALGEGKAGMLARRQAWGEHYGIGAIPNFFVANPVPHVDDLAGNKEVYEEFIGLAKSFSPSYRLVVIDTTGRAMQGVDENRQEHASRFTRLVDSLRADLGCSVLAIQHSGLSDDKRERGSSVFGADADTRIRIDRPDRKKFAVSLHMEKQKDGAEWTEPRHAQLVPMLDSLVVVKSNATVPNAASNAGKRKRGKTEQPTEFPVGTLFDAAEKADKAGYKWLEDTSHRTKITQKDLCAGIGMAIGKTGDAVRKTYLPVLQFNPRYRLHYCFDSTRTVDQGQWFYGKSAENHSQQRRNLELKNEPAE